MREFSSTELTIFVFVVYVWIGAFSGPNDLWTQGWTCNSVVANLRGATACNEVRVS